jgi:hypothetical protein
VVRTSSWDNAGIANAGAVTLVANSSFVTGPISSANSLVGSQINDKVGANRPDILKNGNFVIRSPYWDSGSTVDVGAVTFVNVAIGITGAVSSANSLTGAHGGDKTGLEEIVALANGNYVVRSPYWDQNAVSDVGAVTLGSGTTGVVGIVNETNSLIGTAANDQVGSGGVTPLTNGNYVVGSPLWNNMSVLDAGAATFGNGETGTVGVINESNSLVGSKVNDKVGTWVVALTNGNYVVVSPLWDNNLVVDAGAATWGNGNNGVAGGISISNSLIGLAGGDKIGSLISNDCGAYALADGNYAVASPSLDLGSVTDAGAVTWGNGSTGTFGNPSESNSVVGGKVNDQVGTSIGVLADGGYLILSPKWDRPGVVDAGAVTMVAVATPWAGYVSAANSLVGTSEITGVGVGFIRLPNNSFVLETRDATNAPAPNYMWRSIFTWWSSSIQLIGEVSASNSLIGDMNGLGLTGWSRSLGSGGQWLVEWSSSPGCLCPFSTYAFTWNGGTEETNILGFTDDQNSKLVGGGDASGVSERKYGAYLLNNKSYLMVGGASLTLGVGPSKIVWGNLAGSLGDSYSCLVDEVPGYYSGSETIYDFSFASGSDYVVFGYWPENRVKIYYPNGLPLSNSNVQTSKIVSKDGHVTIESENCTTIASINTTVDNAVTGKITVNSWLENSVPTFLGVPYVARHYQITPATNPGTSKGKITLYFKQEEFNQFNDHPLSILNLPAGPDDVVGKSYLKITKMSGESKSGTGLPATYPTGGSKIINPLEEDIVWNDVLNRWEVTFEVEGFSGFFVHTNTTPLPVRLVSFYVKAVEADAKLNWDIADASNFSHFEVERSENGKRFETIGRINGNPLKNRYEYLDNRSLFHGELLYYRLRMVDRDGSFAYSKIEVLKFDHVDNLKIFPNPFTDILFVQGLDAEAEWVMTDMYSKSGKLVFTSKEFVRNGEVQLRLGGMSIPFGVYLVSIKTGQRTLVKRLTKVQ